MSLRVLMLTACLTLTACHSRSPAKLSVSTISIEAVDAETNGHKSGDTHFTLGNNELFLSYDSFSSSAQAANKLESVKAAATHILEVGDVQNEKGAIEGKFVKVEDSCAVPNQRFCLYWSKAIRYTTVCSESRQAIDDFQTHYQL